ncbi:MAG TPA: hypothetical protein DHU96_09495 [Actinobacteria bacterium]|nr:hypothetical protein [Actinomycetota bacterium]
MSTDVIIRPLTGSDLAEADRICRVAFGTFVGMPEPEQFFGDADLVQTRWKADPAAALAAEVDGRLVGSNFAADPLVGRPCRRQAQQRLRGRACRRPELSPGGRRKAQPAHLLRGVPRSSPPR